MHSSEFVLIKQNITTTTFVACARIMLSSRSGAFISDLIASGEVMARRLMRNGQLDPVGASPGSRVDITTGLITK